MLYLAMTASEIAENFALPEPLAYMACLFSPYGRGLSNLPGALPAGSMLILADRTPISGHDPALIADQLAQTAAALECSRILLDLQRPGEPVETVIEAVLQTALCPVGVSTLYAAEYDCPVLLPPVPLTQTPEAYLAPWAGREIWLELAAEALEISVTASGSRFSPAPPPELPLPFADDALLCHYRLRLTQEEALFTLFRTKEELQRLSCSVPCSIALYQEWRRL